jgi:hypothetical protein
MFTNLFSNLQSVKVGDCPKNVSLPSKPRGNGPLRGELVVAKTLNESLTETNPEMAIS